MSAPLVALAAAVVLVSSVVAGVVEARDERPGRPVVSASAEGPRPLGGRAARFLDDHVTPDGRVVRHDQGGDTVSEGQAYAMLLAVATGDHERFDAVWRWTVEHLQRPDRLLSWLWRDGEVVDAEPAADADLDAAHALALAADRFDDDGYRRAATELAAAVLDEETVVRDGRRLLVAGPWARGEPAVVNPSYFSPPASAVLGAADDRWAAVDAAGRAVLDELAHPRTGLVPDWAEVRGGAAVPSAPPGRDEPARFGYDAARTVIRHAASCDPADLEVAARTWPFFERVVDGGSVVAVYELDGAPATTDRHPLVLVAAAAAASAAGQRHRVGSLLDAAARVQDAHPTYYGAAWLALGEALLDASSPLGCGPQP